LAVAAAAELEGHEVAAAEMEGHEAAAVLHLLAVVAEMN